MKWEYLIKRISSVTPVPGGLPEYPAHPLNALGDDGWEAVSSWTTGGTFVLFKYPTTRWLRKHLRVHRLHQLRFHDRHRHSQRSAALPGQRQARSFRRSPSATALDRRAQAPRSSAQIHRDGRKLNKEKILGLLETKNRHNPSGINKSSLESSTNFVDFVDAQAPD